MDSLADLLDAPRARGAFTLRAVMSAPWSLKIEAESTLTLIAVLKGEFWIAPDDGDAICLAPGDIALIRSPVHYCVSDSLGAPPQIYVHPGQQCYNLAGESMNSAMSHGVRTWGNDPNGSTVFLVGAYEGLSDISERLLRVLPPILSLLHTEWDSPLLSLLSREVVRDQPGQAAVLDRLLDLLLTAVLRAWCAQQDTHRPEWWRIQSDASVESALRLMHEDLAQSWTVNSLATAVGVSRAAFARRFQDIVGESPMTFLQHLRMATAADLLCQPGETVGTVAAKIGYSSPYSFSAAFKRVRGLSPKQHRVQAASAG